MKMSNESALKTSVEAETKRLPDQTALEYHQDLSDSKRTALTISYAHLEESSNRAARYLVSLDLHAEDRVALCLPRGIEFHVFLFGVLKAGCCYVPVGLVNSRAAELPF